MRDNKVAFYFIIWVLAIILLYNYHKLYFIITILSILLHIIGVSLAHSFEKIARGHEPAYCMMSSEADECTSPGNSPTSSRLGKGEKIMMTTQEYLYEKNMSEEILNESKIAQIPRVVLVDLPKDIIDSSIPLVKEGSPFIFGSLASGAGVYNSAKYASGYSFGDFLKNKYASEKKNEDSDFEQRMLKIDEMIEKRLTEERELNELKMRKLIDEKLGQTKEVEYGFVERKYTFKQKIGGENEL